MQFNVLKDYAERFCNLFIAVPTRYFTAENFAKTFDITAELQRDNLAKDAHAALVSCCKYPISNQPGRDFQSLHTRRVPVQLYLHFQHELELWHPALPGS